MMEKSDIERVKTVKYIQFVLKKSDTDDKTKATGSNKQHVATD